VVAVTGDSLPSADAAVAPARAIHVAPAGAAAALAQWVVVLEAMIRRVAEQWCNSFDVWSAIPAS